MRRMFANLGLLALVGCAASAPPYSVVEAPAAAWSAESVETYLRMKEEEFSETAATLQALGRGGQVEILQERVKRSNVIDNAYVVGAGPEQRAAVRDALEHTAAQYMASAGITPERAEIADAAGFDVAGSAARVVTGGGGFHDFVALAEQVVVGTVQDVRGGASGSLTSVLGAGGPAITFSSAGAGTVRQGEECVFFLSAALARFRAASPRHTAGHGDGDIPAQQFEPFCRSNGTFRSRSAYLEQTLVTEEVDHVLDQKNRATGHGKSGE